MRIRFWLRHTRSARFTSLRDVSLRRNPIPALRTGVLLRKPFMLALLA